MLGAAGLYFGARAFTALLGVLAVSAYSRLLEPAAYGVYALVLTSAMIAADVLFQWLRSSVARLLPSEPTVASPVLGTALAGFSLVATPALLATSLLAWSGILAVRADLIALGGLIAVGLASFEIALAVVQARGKARLYLLLSWVRALGALAAGVSLVLAGLGAAGLLAGLLLANLLPVLVMGVRHARPLMASRPRLPMVRTFAGYGLPFVAVSVAGAVIAASDRYVIAAVVGIGEAGAYAAAYDFVQRSLFMVMAAAFLACSPAIFRAHERGGAVDARVRDQVSLFLLTALPLAFVLAAAAPLVARVMFGPEFRADAERLFPWLAIGALLQGLQAFYASYHFTLSRRTGTNAAIVVAGALLNVSLNLLLIPQYGTLAAALVTIASYGGVVIASITLGRRWAMLPWPWGETARSLAACLLATPLLLLAGRTADLGQALAYGAAGCATLGLLLLVLDVGGTRRLLAGKVVLPAAARLRAGPSR